MNIYELNTLIDSLDSTKDKDLIKYYEKKRKELKQIILTKCLSLLESKDLHI